MSKQTSAKGQKTNREGEQKTQTGIGVVQDYFTGVVIVTSNIRRLGHCIIMRYLCLRL